MCSLATLFLFFPHSSDATRVVLLHDPPSKKEGRSLGRYERCCIFRAKGLRNSIFTKTVVAGDSYTLCICRNKKHYSIQSSSYTTPVLLLLGPKKILKIC